MTLAANSKHKQTINFSSKTDGKGLRLIFFDASSGTCFNSRHNSSWETECWSAFRIEKREFKSLFSTSFTASSMALFLLDFSDLYIFSKMDAHLRQVWVGYWERDKTYINVNHSEGFLNQNVFLAWQGSFVSICALSSGLIPDLTENIAIFITVTTFRPKKVLNLT